MTAARKAKAARLNPYTRLAEEFERYRYGVEYPRRRVMFFYAKDKLENGWRLDTVSERVRAADKLGWDVRITVADDGMRFEYVERPK